MGSLLMVGGVGLSKKELGNDGGACVMGKLRDTRVGHLAPRHLCTLSRGSAHNALGEKMENFIWMITYKRAGVRVQS